MNKQVNINLKPKVEDGGFAFEHVTWKSGTNPYGLYDVVGRPDRGHIDPAGSGSDAPGDSVRMYVLHDV